MVYQQKWYVVVVGSEPGVYPTWLEAGPKTKNIPGGPIHQSFLSEDEAIRAFEAAKARGEVRAYPNAGKKVRSTTKSENAPLSPLGTEAAFLRTPSLGVLVRVDAESTGMETPLSSPARSPISQLRRTLRDPTDPCSTFSSPPTGVTTRIYAPLYEDDDAPPNSPAARPSPRFTFTSSASKVCSVVPDGYPLEAGTGEMPLQFGVSDWDSPSTPFSEAHPGAEEHTSKPPRCTPLHPRTPPRRIGVEYRSLTDLDDMESVDSRVWLPKSRVFDPDKVKPRAQTRPSSPAKGITSPTPSHEIIGNGSQFPCQIPIIQSPFVRTDRGRHSGLTPSWSLPILQDQETEKDSPDLGSGSMQPLRNRHTRKGKEKDVDCSVRDTHPAERATGCNPEPRNECRSHVQLVPHDGRDGQSTITVHCPASCPHETCSDSPLVLSVSTAEPSQPTRTRYVDASVSPIITIAARVRNADKTRPKRSDLDEDHPNELMGFTHVPHKRMAPETDVRSPIVKGTMVPMNVAE